MADQRLERHSTMQVSGSDGRYREILVPGSANRTGFPYMPRNLKEPFSLAGT